MLPFASEASDGPEPRGAASTNLGGQHVVSSARGPHRVRGPRKNVWVVTIVGAVFVAVVVATGVAWRHHRTLSVTPPNPNGVALLTTVPKGDTLRGPTDSIALGDFTCRPWTAAELATGAPKGSQDCELRIRVHNDSNTTEDGSLEDWQWGLYAGNAHYDGTTGEIASIFPHQTAPGSVSFTTPGGASPSRVEIVELSPPQYEGYYYELYLHP